MAIYVVVVLVSCTDGRIRHSEYIDTDRWELAWNDEFDYANRDELLKVWESSAQSFTHILSSRWPENVETTGSTVRLVNHKESRGGQDWTSGSINTREDFQYGYFECRYKYASTTGSNNSFWLMTRVGAPAMPLPGAKEPEAGKRFELDINEGHYPDMAIIPWAGEVTDALDGTYMEIDYVRVYKEK